MYVGRFGDNLEACTRGSEKRLHTTTLSAVSHHFRMLDSMADSPVPLLSKKQSAVGPHANK